MTARWHLIKYMPDRRRQEPRNVGLALEVDGKWLIRFIGEVRAGAIDGRLIRGYQFDLEIYDEWIQYFRRKAASADWSDVERASSRGRSSNFFAELAGYSNESEESAEVMLERLFESLVAVPQAAATNPKKELTKRVEEVFDRASIRVIHQFAVDAKYTETGRTTKVSFEYGYQNGQLHLMEELFIGSRTGRALAKARELRARMEAARLANSANSFVVFYSGAKAAADVLDDVLLPLEAEARAINVDNTDAAAAVVKDITGY